MKRIQALVTLTLALNVVPAMALADDAPRLIKQKVVKEKAPKEKVLKRVLDAPSKELRAELRAVLVWVQETLKERREALREALRAPDWRQRLCTWVGVSGYDLGRFFDASAQAKIVAKLPGCVPPKRDDRVVERSSENGTGN